MRQSVKQRNWYDIERGGPLIVAASVTIGDITVDVTPPTDVAVASFGGTGTADLTIPANTKYVYIENLGGLAPAIGTVNGLPLPPGARFERVLAQDGVNRYLLPSYVIVTNGSLIEYYYET